eukprot:335264_1
MCLAFYIIDRRCDYPYRHPYRCFLWILLITLANTYAYGDILGITLNIIYINRFNGVLLLVLCVLILQNIFRMNRLNDMMMYTLFRIMQVYQCIVHYGNG